MKEKGEGNKQVMLDLPFQGFLELNQGSMKVVPVLEYRGLRIYIYIYSKGIYMHKGLTIEIRM